MRAPFLLKPAHALIFPENLRRSKLVLANFLRAPTVRTSPIGRVKKGAAGGG